MALDLPNYTQLPNVILDEWLPKLSGGELKVIFCICRKTFGWQKSKDSISNKQISEATGLSLRSIPEITERLAQHGLINKVAKKKGDGSDDANEYQLNLRSAPILPHVAERTSPTVPNVGGGSEVTSGGGSELSSGGGSEVASLTKERTKKRVKEKKEIHKEKVADAPDSACASSSPSSSSSKAEKKAHEKDYVQHGEFVRLKPSEHEALRAKYGVEALEEMIETINDSIESGAREPYKPRGYAAALRNWFRNKGQWDAQRGRTSPHSAGPPSSISDSELFAAAKPLLEKEATLNRNITVGYCYLEVRRGYQIEQYRVGEPHFRRDFESYLKERQFYNHVMEVLKHVKKSA